MRKIYLGLLLGIVFILSVGNLFSQSWQQITSPTTSLYQVTFATDDIGWVTSGSNIYKTTNGGTSWILQNTPSDIGGIERIKSFNSSIIWAAGTDYPMKSTDGGSSWQKLTNLPSQPVPPNTLANTNDIFFPNSLNSDIVFIGSRNQIFKTLNGGTSWTSIALPNNVGFGNGGQGNAFYALNENIMWICGYNYSTSSGVIYKTTNAGVTWNLQYSSTTYDLLTSITFLDANNGYAVGYHVVLKTTDGGTTWTPCYNSYNIHFEVDAIGTNVWVTENQIPSYLKFSNNSGSTWVSQYDGAFSCIFARSTTLAYGTLNGKLMKYSNSSSNTFTCTSTCALRFQTPKDNSKDIPTIPQIVWQAVPSATSYVIELADNSGNRINGFNYPNANDLIIATVNAPSTEFLTFSSFGTALGYNTAFKIKITAKQNTTEIACGISTFTTIPAFVCQGASYNSLYQGTNMCFKQPITSFYNVIAKFNGAFNWQSSNYCTYASGMCTDYMCTEYTKRFYQDFWNINLTKAGIYGNKAKTYGLTVESHTESGLIFYHDGGLKSPQKGDILVYEGSTYPSHVSIVSNVTATEISIIQQNAYPAIETFSKSGNNVDLPDVLGWVRPAPINFKPYNTSTSTLSFTTSITGATFEIYFEKQDGTCYTPVTNYNPFALPVKTSSQVNLQAGKYRAKVTANLSNSIGTVNSDFHYFELAVQTIVNIPANGGVTVNTVATNQKKSNSTPTNACNIRISQFINGEWYYKGYTNENGNLFAEFVPALQSGDVIKAEGNGYETKEITITENMLNESNVPISLNQIITPDIVNPQILVVDNLPIFTQNTANLKIKAKNHTKYILSNTINEEEIAYTNEHIMSDSVISVSLFEGSNRIFVTYINDVDTVTLMKSIYYQTSPQASNSYSVTIYNGEGVKMYLNGSFISYLPSNMEMLSLPVGTNNLVFENAGYKTIYQTVDNTASLTLSFEEIVTKVQEIEFEKIAKIYPNPSDGIFKIELIKANQNVSIDIYNLVGKLVLSEKKIDSNSFDINLSNYQTGVFIISLTVDNKQYKYKILKK